MADTKITGFTATTTPATTDVLPIVIDPGGTSLNRKVTLGNLLGTDLVDLIARWVAASASGPASLAFAEDTDNGTNTVTLIAPASLGSDIVLTLPTTTGTVQLTSTGLTDLISRYVAPSVSGPASLDFLEDSDNGTNKITLIAPASLSADFVVTFPSATGTLVNTDQVYAQAQAVNAQTGTTYTLVAGDAGKLVTLSNASAITLTLPQDSDATIAIGTYVDLYALGAGQITTAAGTGATLRTSGLTAKSRAQYARMGVQKVSANTWSLFGDLAAS